MVRVVTAVADEVDEGDEDEDDEADEADEANEDVDVPHRANEDTLRRNEMLEIVQEIQDALRHAQE
jgi:hypothetical protein